MATSSGHATFFTKEYLPSYVLDGNYDGLFWHSEHTHDALHWLQIDTGVAFWINRVTLVTRKKCCQERFDGIEVSGYDWCKKC